MARPRWGWRPRHRGIISAATGPNGFGQRRPCIARQARDEKVGGATAGADVVDPQDRIGAGRPSIMGEPHPGELIEVAVGASSHEPGGHRRRRAPGTVAVRVGVAGPVDPVGVVVELEGSGGHGEQPVAGGAAKPSRENGDGYADARPVVIGVVRGLGLGGECAENFDLQPDARSHRVEEPVLGDDCLAGDVPPVEATHHDAEAGEVDERAHAIGVDGLARADGTHPHRPVVGAGPGHCAPSSDRGAPRSARSASSAARAFSRPPSAGTGGSG